MKHIGEANDHKSENYKDFIHIKGIGVIDHMWSAEMLGLSVCRACDSRMNHTALPLRHGRLIIVLIVALILRPSPHPSELR